MGRRVLVLERSPLARNIYLMLLAGVDDVDLISEEPGESFSKKIESEEDLSLVMVSQSTLGDNKKDLMRLIKETKFPYILFVRRGELSKWKEYSELKNVEIMERPFNPEEFVKTVKKVWGIK